MKIHICLFLGMLGILLLSPLAHAQDEIRDISRLKQDHFVYLSGKSDDSAIVDREIQQTLNESFSRRYFSVWQQEKPRCTRDDILWDFNKYGANPGYGENHRRHEPAWVEALRHSAGLDQYPNRGIRGITVANTDLRALPTSGPLFDGLDNDSGYPFDRLQISTITVNSPVYISHVGEDKDWVHVETGTYFGWVSARDVVPVDDDLANFWQSGRYAVVIRDRIPIYDEKGRFCFKAPLGAQFPLIREGVDFWEIRIVVPDQNGQAVSKVARLGREHAALRPLKMTRANLARVANELINQPYGWGGLYGNRDCSSMLMDFFAPFGIWLPRNSKQQAHETGRFIDLGNLSPEEKEAAILSSGIPYATLIWRKGHIMLYMGSFEGKVLIFHNMWGVTTQDIRGRRGRRIVGRSVITTLRPGIECCSGLAPGCDPLQSILGMTLLLPDAPKLPEPGLSPQPSPPLTNP